MDIKTRLDNFLLRATTAYNNKYDYSLVKYTRRDAKVIIICPEHGQFMQQPNNHWSGQGCPKCKSVSISNKTTKTTEWFIAKARGIFHNCYDYSKTNYINYNKKLIIICPTHGEFTQVAGNHLAGHGCRKCSDTNNAAVRTKTLSTFIQEASIKHSNKYTYGLVDYKTAHIPVKITCLVHGIFLCSPHNHYQGKGCPKCNTSHGEEAVRLWLKSKMISFSEQKTFAHCINPESSRKLKFDFYLPDKNILIDINTISQ